MKNEKMLILKNLALLICFTQIFYYSVADNSTTIVDSVIHRVLPDCFFGVETISFILYTRNVTEGIVLTAENITSTYVLEENISSLPIMFLAHGFISNANNSNYLQLTKALLAKVDALVISVDWKEGACSGGLAITKLAGYSQAVKNTRIVGQYIANLTKELIDKYDAKLDDMQVIGHSLGAHVMGFAGKEIQKLNLGKYPQIIGLDPAGPLFNTKSCSQRLCESDADFVQIIHTTSTLGMTKEIGDMDFYMNKGILQPGCNGNPACSHSQAVIYLTESVKYDCCFIGTPWTNYLITKPISTCTKDTCACVGLNAKDYPARGKFYVEIERDPPHCNNVNATTN